MPLIFPGTETTSKKRVTVRAGLVAGWRFTKAASRTVKGMHVIHVSRTDVNPEDDVAVLGLPTDANVQSTSWT